MSDYMTLVKRCETLARNLVPDVEFECWKSPTIENIDEALVLWAFIIADFPDNVHAGQVAEALEQLKQQVRHGRRISEVDLTEDNGWQPPLEYKPLTEVLKERGGFLWWHR